MGGFGVEKKENGKKRISIWFIHRTSSSMMTSSTPQKILLCSHPFISWFCCVDMSSPRLTINQQDSLAKLLLTTKTGVPRDVHVVVKNTPFNVVLGVANNFPSSRAEHIDLSRCTISVGVHYDSDDPREGKQVKLMTSKPCEYKVHLSDKRADEATLEVRMKVLTSQHEDMLFRLHISVSNNNTSQVLRTTTAAIKVVSKPDQVRRINGEKGKKRTHADMVNESLERIEKRQQQQQALLMKVLKSCNPQNGGELRLSSSTSLDDLPSPMRAPPSLTAQPTTTTEKTVSIPVPNGKMPLPNSSVEDMSFEAAFALCMKKYAALPTSERPAKMRKIVSTSSARDTRSIFEFSDALRGEGLRNFPDTKPTIAPSSAHVSTPAPSNPPVVPPSSLPLACQPKIEPSQEGYLTEFPSSLSSSLSFSDPSMTTDFVHEMFQNALSPFHF